MTLEIDGVGAEIRDLFYEYNNGDNDVLTFIYLIKKLSKFIFRFTKL